MKSNKRLIVIASGLVILLGAGAALAGLLRPSPFPVPDPIELKVSGGAEPGRRTQGADRVDDEVKRSAGNRAARPGESGNDAGANEATGGGEAGQRGEGSGPGGGAGDGRAGDD
jgi:hypothetical protein